MFCALSWRPVPLGDGLAPQRPLFRGRSKGWEGQEPTDGNGVGQEKQNEGCQMPDRILTVELKLWNFTGLPSFIPILLFYRPLFLHLGSMNMSYKATNANRNACGPGVPLAGRGKLTEAGEFSALTSSLQRSYLTRRILDFDIIDVFSKLVSSKAAKKSSWEPIWGKIYIFHKLVIPRKLLVCTMCELTLYTYSSPQPDFRHCMTDS